MYKCTGEYDKASERSVKWNDETIGIKWAGHINDHIVSDKDAIATSFKEADIFI